MRKTGIEELAAAMKNARRAFVDIKKEIAADSAGNSSRRQPPIEVLEYEGTGEAGGICDGNVHLGDNLEYMIWLMTDGGMAGKINLIYIDPPFFTKENFGAVVKPVTDDGREMPDLRQRAFDDRWSGSREEYLTMLALRLMIMRELLAEDGCIFLHLDWHVSHYFKIIMDEIFGEECFVNEIIWHYKSGGASRRAFARKHDNILFYGKSTKYNFVPVKEKSYNRGYKPYRFKGVEEFQDETGWYTMVNMKDVWEIDMVGRSSGERLNYATQKPLALVRRMLESCTRPGDICGDFFCGSGTLAQAAAEMNRRFICCDMGRLAVSKTVKRLFRSGAGFKLTESASEAAVNAALYPALRRGVVKLEGYLPDRACINLDRRSMADFEEIVQTSPVALVDFWCVGRDRNSKIRVEKVVIRDGIHLDEAEIGGISANDRKDIRVIVWDLFGNRTEEKLL